MTQYWLCILDRENWDVVQKERIWGVTERHRNTIMKTKIGDQLLFYLIGERVEGRKLESAIGGQAEVISKVYEDTKRIFKSDAYKGIGRIFPLRIKLSCMRSFGEGIPFRPLITELEFIENRGRWGGHIQGRAMRIISENDYRTIIESSSK